MKNLLAVFLLTALLPLAAGETPGDASADTPPAATGESPAQTEESGEQVSFWQKHAERFRTFCSETKDSLKRTYREWTTPRAKLELEEQAALRKACACVVGDYAARKFPGKRIVPIMSVYPGMELTDDFEVFREHAGTALVVNPVYIVPPASGHSIPGDAPTSEQLNEAFLACLEKRADVVVCFSPLPPYPQDREKLVFWNWDKDDACVILVCVEDPLMISRGKMPHPVSAFVTPDSIRRVLSPRRVFSDDEPQAAFDMKFLLLTEENADELIKARKIVLAK